MSTRSYSRPWSRIDERRYAVSRVVGLQPLRVEARLILAWGAAVAGCRITGASAHKVRGALDRNKLVGKSGPSLGDHFAIRGIFVKVSRFVGVGKQVVELS